MSELSEKEFQYSLEEVLNRDIAIECLIIGKPDEETTWFIGLRIAEMIKEYLYQKLNKEISVYFSILLEDVIPNVDKMNSYDIQILRIHPFEVEGLFAYFDSKREEKKNFIYISREAKPLNKINKKIASLVLYHIYVLSKSKDKILCEIQTQKGKKEVEFSYPNKELIENYYIFRKETYEKVLKKQVQE